MVSIKLPTHGKGTVAFKNTMAGIEKIWKQVYPDKPFEYSFFDDTIAAFYEKEQQTRQIINAAMIVAISLSCMGLLGLITYTTERRTKEIGVRKVLGASVTDITVMLCKDFVLLVLIAIVIASPVAWYFMHQWLQGFPYRVAISGWVFLLAGISAIGIALIAVSFKAIKAAMANPVKNLRTE
jgi:ABC-type antimicrobial peptide transport system permease subunit